MYKSFKDINKIKFPVYALPSSDWYRQDGVLFINDGKVLDDSNMPGETLGVRRIQCGRKDLQPLRRAYTAYPSMLASKKKIFIDSKGTPFIYTKTNTCPLKYHRVKRIELKDDLSTVWLEDIPNPFTIPRPPYGDARYARVLYFNGYPWLIYDFALQRGKDSFKRV
jgi:hypothetical protein